MFLRILSWRRILNRFWFDLASKNKAPEIAKMIKIYLKNNTFWLAGHFNIRPLPGPILEVTQRGKEPQKPTRIGIQRLLEPSWGRLAPSWKPLRHSWRRVKNR